MQIIGEKINIITKYIAKAVEEKDPKPIQELAKKQVAGGATHIDVNIGPARKSGQETMAWLVNIIQEVVDVPLCLDTTNHAAIEAGLKVHRGKAIINSTSAARERMETMFPLAAEYNANIIGLALAGRGMPGLATASPSSATASKGSRAITSAGIALSTIWLTNELLAPFSKRRRTR